MSARRRRRIRLRTTALPTFRLIAYATRTLGASETSVTKLIRSEPLCPRPVGVANKANCRRGRTRSGTLRLDRQVVSALVAAGFQDGASGTGSHARTKTVRFSPFALVGLIGTLHNILFSNISLRF